MKFFFITLISSYLFLSWVCLDDVQGIPEPSHLLSVQYSKHHNQLPRNVAPNIVYLTQETLVEVALRYAPLASLQERLYLSKVDILNACEYDLYLQPPSGCEHSQNHKFELVNHDTFASNRPLKHDNGIWWTKQDDNLDYLLYGNSFGNYPYNKAKIFIETKVSAMKLQGFNL
jgi:hypothetical protein